MSGKDYFKTLSEEELLREIGIRPGFESFTYLAAAADNLTGGSINDGVKECPVVISALTVSESIANTGQKNRLLWREQLRLMERQAEALERIGDLLSAAKNGNKKGGR
ncbi:hypothetical protein SAMN05421690_102826 [Nitrosomonas sp. Nm51]|uniref:hypothetical protein n=1 Tax=Nitrosomonas sp. Nm51 TaxID=133720 RepID=UPI0008C011E3|nr:hypothetical protein [Nitrosomonas sp. Nm51]SER46110.1 hypothetical protein SAMN05421690_102826 [Nitrosomonas sp. Nm51]